MIMTAMFVKITGVCWTPFASPVFQFSEPCVDNSPFSRALLERDQVFPEVEIVPLCEILPFGDGDGAYVPPPADKSDKECVLMSKYDSSGDNGVKTRKKGFLRRFLCGLHI